MEIKEILNELSFSEEMIQLFEEGNTKEAIAKFKETQKELNIASVRDELKTQYHNDAMISISNTARGKAKKLIEAGLVTKEEIESKKPQELVSFISEKTLEYVDKLKAFEGQNLDEQLETLKQQLREAKNETQKAKEDLVSKLQAKEEEIRLRDLKQVASSKWEDVFNEVVSKNPLTEGQSKNNIRDLLKLDSSDYTFIPVDGTLKVYKSDGVSEVAKPDGTGFFKNANEFILFNIKRRDLLKKNTNKGSIGAVKVTVAGTEKKVDMSAVAALDAMFDKRR